MAEMNRASPLKLLKELEEEDDGDDVEMAEVEEEPVDRESLVLVVSLFR